MRIKEKKETAAIVRFGSLTHEEEDEYEMSFLPSLML